MIGYRAVILDAEAKTPAENHLCHTFFGAGLVMEVQGREMKAVYSDAFTREVNFPRGFGFRLTPEDDLHWTPMFNNRGEDLATVKMKGQLTVIRERELKKPLTPLYSILFSMREPHLFFVRPGRDERHTTFELPFDGMIHFIGTHIHPYGESIDLFNVSRQERLWKGNRQNDASGQMVGMDVYSSGKGYAVKAGEKFRLTSVYENPTKYPIDAMAGVFVFYSRDGA